MAVLGDAVNVASRIERFATDGGISLTQPVYDQVWNKFELSIKSLGRKRLKHVCNPVEAYRVLLPWERSYPRAENKVFPALLRLGTKLGALFPAARHPLLTGG